MSSIVYQTNPSTGVKYAYESISYWDKEKKAPRSKRRSLGRVDPETGEIIKGTRKRKNNAASEGTDSENSRVLQNELEKKDTEIASLRKQLEEMTARLNKAEHILEDIRTLTDSLRNV
jgi:molecular chaperone GrpE (heat shock protein)